MKNIILKTLSDWNGTKYKPLNINNPEVTVLNIKIGIGERLPMHKHDMLNIAYVKSGTLTVYTEQNEQITVHEGECLPEVVEKYHYGKNTGNKPLELIVFYVGEKDTPLSVNKNID